MVCSLKSIIHFCLTLCLLSAHRATSQQATPYEIIFSNPNIVSNECATEVLIIQNQAFVPFVAEMIEVTYVTPDNIVSLRPDLMDSAVFMDQYSSSLDSSYSSSNNYYLRRGRKLPVCTAFQCANYNIVQLATCSNCRRRLDEDLKQPFKRILASTTGNSSNIPPGRGSEVITLVYELISLLPQGTCKTKMSQMSFSINDVNYL